mmetsp:Transcript_15874/g.24433  ORF Transcript_15874/g.24433 Transcript_15874/m.24433 type:complete len:94 (+) Transcript_15874:2731-3012(+)
MTHKMSLCPNCSIEDPAIGYLSTRELKGYRKHILFDLLKDKADLFFNKMSERRALESKDENAQDDLSQDSENYEEEVLKARNGQPPDTSEEIK